VSVELRVEDGEFVCDWGNFPHSNPRPDRREVGELMIATREYVEQLKAGSLMYHGAVHSVKEKNGRMFARIDWYRKHWTWELHEARWWDGAGPEVLVGRWPD
jgi:hypothetical protein